MYLNFCRTILPVGILNKNTCNYNTGAILTTVIAAQKSIDEGLPDRQ